MDPAPRPTLARACPPDPASVSPSIRTFVRVAVLSILHGTGSARLPRTREPLSAARAGAVGRGEAALSSMCQPLNINHRTHLGVRQQMIEARGLSKRYGTKLAVDQLSFQVRPGSVTGFLGPNGAGKSTTMRMILGLDTPTGGNVTVNGRPYHQVQAPLREMGALLDAKAMHGGRTAYNHLLCLAQSNGIPNRRVDEVLGMV